MDWDCQLLILEELDIESLINASQVNTVLKYLANDVFIRKFIGERNKSIDRVNINLPDQYGSLNMETSKVKNEIKNGTLNLHHSDAKGFLKAFGHFIDHLEIDFYEVPSQEHSKFGYLINKFCSRTLLEFIGHFADESLFDMMQKPFKRVKKFIFPGLEFITQTKNLKLHELFPEVYSLFLANRKSISINPTPPSCHFPNLHTLEISTCGYNQLSKFISKNPQIGCLSCTSVKSKETFHHINQFLPEIEQLQIRLTNADFLIYNRSESHQRAHFKHVKELTLQIIIDHFDGFRRENIEDEFIFENLETLRFGVHRFLTGPIEIGNWIKFITNHNQIRSFHMTGGYINETTLLHLTKELNNLVNASIRYFGDADVQNVVAFLEANKNMENFVIKFLSTLDVVVIESLMDDLNENLGRNWNISFSRCHYSQFDFVRINLNKEEVIQSQECSETNFEGIKLVDLLKNANKSENCLGLATRTFEENFSIKKFAIHSPTSSNEAIITDYSSLDTVHIYDIQSTINLLKFFGNLISKLSVSYVDANKYQEINDLIIKQCTESLTEIHFGSFEGNTWIDQAEPFNRVRKLSIGRTIEKRENKSMSLEKLFPYTEEVDLDSIECFDDTFVEQVFPSLKKISVKLAPYNRSNYLKASDVGKLLKQNSQIRSLEVNGVEIVDYLDGLNQLEKISIDHAFLNATTFERLAALCQNFTNLTEVFVNCESDVVEESLINFMKDNRNLQRFYLKVHGRYMFWYFSKYFKESDWNVTEICVEPDHWSEPSACLIFMER